MRGGSCGETPAPAPAMQAGTDGDGAAGTGGCGGGGGEEDALDLSHDVILHRRTRNSTYVSTPNHTHRSRRQHRSLPRVQGGEHGERAELSASELAIDQGARGWRAQGSAPALLMMSATKRRASLKEASVARVGETSGSKVGQGGARALGALNDTLLTPVKGVSGSIIFNVIRDGEGLPVAYTPKPNVTLDRAQGEASFRPCSLNPSIADVRSHVQAAAPSTSPSLSDGSDIRGEHARVSTSLQELLARRDKAEAEIQAARKQLPHHGASQAQMLYDMLRLPTATRNRAQCRCPEAKGLSCLCVLVCVGGEGRMCSSRECWRKHVCKVAS